jgi:hypothetical protein
VSTFLTSASQNPTGSTILSAAQGVKDLAYMSSTSSNSAYANSCPNQGISHGGGYYLWQPDLRKDEQKITFAIMVKF